MIAENRRSVNIFYGFQIRFIEYVQFLFLFMIAKNRRSVNLFCSFKTETCVIIAPVIRFFMRAREKIITKVRKTTWILIKN